ncbi:caspase family protein [Meridianimarinicoccus sp. MJW13]|uniref:caspase family protein n=1 Tax=Meridianimarinicoccus sp. MJW13 TaxID=2720031 RepID=UPI0018669E74|nr:caspase family protein [Fluviibacterium sp. MJW13]
MTCHRAQMRAILTGAALWAGSGALALDQSYEKPGGLEDWGRQLQYFVQGSELGYRRSYALVIGISQFEHFTTLPTASDPIRMKDFLLDEAGFDYVHLLTEKDVTPQRVRQLMLDDFRQRVGAEDRMLFYWSGHGHTELNRRGEPSGYLPVASAQAGQLSQMVSMERLTEWDSHIKANQVLYLLDSCFSGFAGTVSKSSTRDITLSQMARPSRHIITAGTYEQETIATERISGSIFTYAVLEALRGIADTESGGFERDGLVTVNEIEDYVKKRVKQLADAAGWRRPITPQVWDLGANEGEFFFVSTNRKQETLAKQGGQFVGMEYGIPKSSDGRAIRPYHMGDDPISEQSLFVEAVLTSNAAGLERYLATFPDSDYSDLARNAHRNLGALGGRPHDDADTDTLFWESIRASVLPVEFQLYLDLFPGGAYRDLARARMSALERAGEVQEFLLAGQPMSTHARLRQDALNKARELPLEFVQYGLIALGYPIDDPAGVMTSQTRRAARAYQASVGAEQTGVLTPWQRVDVVLKAAQIGDDHAETATGIMMAEGMGLPKNEAMARKWLERAARKGNGYAQANLAILYRDGRGGDADSDRARTLLQQAVDQDIPGAGELLETL